MSNYQKSRVKSFLRAIKPKPFHASNLEYIKKVIGASFVGFQNYQDLYHLRIVKDKVEGFYKLHGTPNDMTKESYKDLLVLILNDINEKSIISKLGKNEGA